jgi:hypothetical protein
VLLIYSTDVSLFFNKTFEHINEFVPSRHGFKISVAVEIGLLHSQPSKSHSHFIIIVGSATCQVLLQRPKQMEFRRGKCRTGGGGGWSRSSQRMTAAALDVALQCWRINCRDRCPDLFLLIASRRIHSVSQWGLRVDCCALRHKFNVDDSFRIPEYRCHNFSCRLTYIEFFGSRRSWVCPLHSSLFCLWIEVVHTCPIGCHCGYQELVPLSFKSLKM